MPPTLGEKQIRIAARMYEARDAAKRIYGERFPQKVSEFQSFIRAEMKMSECGELKATMRIVQKLQGACPDSAGAQMMILAACVELIEPSAPRPAPSPTPA